MSKMTAIARRSPTFLGSLAEGAPAIPDRPTWSRLELEEIIEVAIALLDEMDGDADLEPEIECIDFDYPRDFGATRDGRSPGGYGDPDDAEPSLGWVSPYWEQEAWRSLAARSGRRL